MSITIICLFSLSVGVGAVGVALAGANFVDNQLEKRKGRRFLRKINRTSYQQPQVLTFVRWFQNHQDLCNSTIQGVGGILPNPCDIPQLGFPFKCGDVVLTFNGISGSQPPTYMIQVSSKKQAHINAFWQTAIAEVQAAAQAATASDSDDSSCSETDSEFSENEGELETFSDHAGEETPLL